MVMGGRLELTRAGRCERHPLRAALLAGVLAIAPALLPAVALASPRENPLPPLPVMQPHPGPQVITPPPDDGLEAGGFYIEANQLLETFTLE